jgi:preprotein translocase subunit SecB
MFLIENMDERAREAFLLIEGPRLIFPFARRILADATRDGGFPPLMLEPIDFAALYRQKAAATAAWRADGRPTGRDSLIRRLQFPPLSASNSRVL